jgi:hypothetical protein
MTRESKSAFARRLGVSKSYVSRELAQSGRLVMADGLVDVEASLARIDATKDPNRADVAQRHAAARDAKRLADAALAKANAAPGAFSGGGEGVDQGKAEKNAPRADIGIPISESEPVIQAAEVFRKARAAKMHFEARRAVIRVARIGGRLAEVATIRKCAGNDGATLRSMLENLPDQAAPRLAPVRDPAGVAVILGELLDDVAATMAGLLTKNSAAMRESEAV